MSVSPGSGADARRAMAPSSDARSHERGVRFQGRDFRFANRLGSSRRLISQTCLSGPRFRRCGVPSARSGHRHPGRNCRCEPAEKREKREKGRSWNLSSLVSLLSQVTYGGSHTAEPAHHVSRPTPPLRTPRRSGYLCDLCTNVVSYRRRDDVGKGEAEGHLDLTIVSGRLREGGVSTERQPAAHDVPIISMYAR